MYDTPWYQDWFYYKPRRVWRKIKLVFNYLPILWNTADYDYRSAIDLFKYQLNRIAKFMDSDRALSVNSRRNAEKIRTCTRLMEKIYNEEYVDEFIDKVYEEYGTRTFGFVDDHRKTFNPLTNKEEGLYRMVPIYDNLKKDISPEEYDKILKDAYEKGYEKHKKANRLLWKIISENINDWWD